LAGKLGDLPTMKVEADRFAAFAKRADGRAREGRAASAPDIQVSLEYLEEVPTAVRRSAMLPVARTLEGASLEAVPVIAVAKEDLAWFEFESDTHALLALIDGRTSVREILMTVAVDPERAMELLRDLELQRVIALG
jgi:hypothetical protein